MINKKVLVVDDNEDILEAIQITLEMSGFEVALAKKGSEVYKKVESFNPGVILLDVLLSGEDGRLICKKLKGDEKTKDIAVIMLSAHPQVEKTIEEFGADDFIPKPFDIHQLTTKVNQYF